MHRLQLYILNCLIIILILFPCYASAENVEHENILKVQYGGEWRQDQYLTPLLYKGMMVGIGNEWWQPFRQDTRLGKTGKLEHWKHIGQLNLKFDWTHNPVKTNIIYALNIDAGWGAYYEWCWQDVGVKIFLGPYLDCNNTIKYHSINVNKPVSLDLTTNVQAMTGVSYSFKGKKTSYRLRYLIRFNLLGVDFMPDYWQSYYELTKKVRGQIRCAGMWNHRTLHHELTLDLQFPHSTWRVGICHEYDEYGQKDMMFSNECVSAIVGTCFHYKLNPHKNFTIF